MPGVAHSDSGDSNAVGPDSKVKTDASDAEFGSNAGSEGGSEYEIEEVLDAKRGYFPDGRMGYYVKWKGYGSEDNSWVDEVDAVNAKDLVDEFWRKNPKKQKKLLNAKLAEKKSPKKGRKSVASEEVSDSEDALTSKKRGRKSTSQKPDPDDMDVDEIEQPPKKARISTQNSKSKMQMVKSSSPESETPIIGNMKQYMGLKSWEGLVKTVDTVEKASESSNSLVIYFTLNTGEKVMEASTICKERFPQKLIEFYESNLRWKTVEDATYD